jgi:uncharacterized membrane protein YraQ (UPF0718 family)
MGRLDEFFAVKGTKGMWVELWALARVAGHITVELWWFIAIAVFIAATMSTLRLDTKVAQYLRRAKGQAVLGALLLGLVSPL